MAALVADDHDRLAVVGTDAADDRGIVAERPVAVELEEVGAEALHVVERLRPVDVARELDPLPRGQRLVECPFELSPLGLEPAQLARIGGAAIARPPQRLDARV